MRMNKKDLLLTVVQARILSQKGAESLVAEAERHPGEWRQSGKIRVRRNGDGEFSVEMGK